MDAKNSPCVHTHNHISNSTIINDNCFTAKWFMRIHQVLKMAWLTKQEFFFRRKTRRGRRR